MAGDGSRFQPAVMGASDLLGSRKESGIKEQVWPGGDGEEGKTEAKSGEWLWRRPHDQQAPTGRPRRQSSGWPEFLSVA